MKKVLTGGSSDAALPATAEPEDVQAPGVYSASKAG